MAQVVCGLQINAGKMVCNCAEAFGIGLEKLVILQIRLRPGTAPRTPHASQDGGRRRDYAADHSSDHPDIWIWLWWLPRWTRFGILRRRRTQSHSDDRADSAVA